MKKGLSLFTLFASYALCITLLSSCSKDDVGNYQPTNYDVKGKVEKGPFVSGSSIDLQPMDVNLKALGSTYSSTISDNIGNFSFGSQTLDTPFAQLTANGYFFNEVEGKLSDGQIMLRAIISLANKSSVNVNLLTHLKYQRVLNLVQGGKSFDEANTQAQKELLGEFGLQRFADTDVSQYSITAGTNEAGALIAVSSLLLYDRTEAELTEYLASLSEEFSENGCFSESTKTQFKKDRSSLKNYLSSIERDIKERYTSLGMDVSVKDLRYFFDWNDDGIAGNEIAGNDNPVTLEQTELNVPKQGGKYSIKINTTIPLTLTQPNSGDYNNSPNTGSFADSLYDTQGSTSLTYTSKIENNTLQINVSPSTFRSKHDATINIYDYTGSLVASLKINQEGNPNATIPKLGTSGKSIVADIASSLSSAISDYNTLNVYYTGIKNNQSYKAPLSSSNESISNCWNYFYNTINRNLQVKYYDETNLNVYQSQLNTFNALCYYKMVTLWGSLPYITSRTIDAIPRTAVETILNSLIGNLETAINELDEKKNTFSEDDANEFFFVSKDVARNILANIYMYKGEYSKAKDLLDKIILNGYYKLDSSVDYNSNSSDLIFGYNNSTRSTSVIPVLTYTDVILSLAECEKHLGNTTSAKKYLKEVTDTKGISVSSDIITGIKEARKKAAPTCDYFEFLKRNDIAMAEIGLTAKYQLLFPIPLHEIGTNPSMTQNPGY